ncbi:sirohydrochlorin chelatase [Jatrophihabitans fulvus]
MDDRSPRLLAVAHGTASPAGRSTIETLVAALRARRPHVPVDLCFLDVIGPTLADSLDERPTVAVPLLLSTGFHVQSDIPEAVAPFPATRVARHLGPDDLLVDALLARLGDAGAITGEVVLVGAGSSRSGARVELDETAGRLGHRLDRPVPVLTMADDLAAAFALLSRPLHVATYLLAEGSFTERVASLADARTTVAAPLGDHPAVVELVWRRYDEATADGPVV